MDFPDRYPSQFRLSLRDPWSRLLDIPHEIDCIALVGLGQIELALLGKGLLRSRALS